MVRQMEDDLKDIGGCPYKLLNVPERSDLAVCERAYKAKIRQNHPDKNGVTDYAQKLNLAMECLRRDDWKPVYDRSILLSRVRASPPPPPPPPPQADADVNMYADMFTKKHQQPKRSGKVHQTKKEKRFGRRRKYQESAAAHSAGSASQQAPGPSPAKKKNKSKKKKRPSQSPDDKTSEDCHSGKYTNLCICIWLSFLISTTLFFISRCRYWREEGSSIVF